MFTCANEVACGLMLASAHDEVGLRNSNLIGLITGFAERRLNQ